MKLKNTVLTLSLLAAASVAITGCGRGVNVIDFAGHGTSPSSSDEVLTDVVPTTEPSGNDIVPENPSQPVTATPETPVEEPAEDVAEDPFCPSGTVSQGNPYLCCRIDDPQVCFFVHPGPGGGGGKPHLADRLPDAEIFVDPTPPPPPPPDSGGNVGGGSVGDSDGVGCHFQGPTGGRRMKNIGGMTGDATEDELTANDCIML